jgi:hypothetical protein
MKETALICGGLLLLLVGGLIGYAIAVEQVHKEAVANRHGHWTVASNYSVVFAWGPAPKVQE